MPTHMASRSKRSRMRTLFRLQRGLCSICGLLMPDPDECRARGEMLTRHAPSLDHQVPQKHGGANSLSNLLLAHKHCNEMRATNRPPKRSRQMAELIRTELPR